MWDEDDKDAVRAGVRERMEPGVNKELEKEWVQSHLSRVCRAYSIPDPGVGVLGVRLPQDLLFETLDRVQVGQPVYPATARAYETKGAKTYVGELEKLLALLHAFRTGAMEVCVLMLYSRTAGPRKKGLRTLLTVPPTVLHIPLVRAAFRLAVDPEVRFSNTPPRGVAGIISSVRWAVEAAAFFHIDSAYFIELEFPLGEGKPIVRFNTGQGLASVPATPWVAALLNFATQTVDGDFFGEGDPPIFVSVILSPGHYFVTGVTIADARARTGTPSPAPSPDAPEGTGGPDGPAATPPLPEPRSSTPTGVSPV